MTNPSPDQAAPASSHATLFVFVTVVIDAMGIGIIATGLTRSEYVLGGTIALLVVGTLVLVVYSYIVWKNDPNRVPALETSPAEGNDKPLKPAD